MTTSLNGPWAHHGWTTEGLEKEKKKTKQEDTESVVTHLIYINQSHGQFELDFTFFFVVFQL